MNKETGKSCVVCSKKSTVRRELYIFIENTQKFSFTGNRIYLCKKCDKDALPCFIVDTGGKINITNDYLNIT